MIEFNTEDYYAYGNRFTNKNKYDAQFLFSNINTFQYSKHDLKRKSQDFNQPENNISLEHVDIMNRMYKIM